MTTPLPAPAVADVESHVTPTVFPVAITETYSDMQISDS